MGAPAPVQAAETCNHKWTACLTPPDSGSPWYRCDHCQAFGYRKQAMARHVLAYVCSIKRCSRPAIDRLHGRGPRMSYRWRCRKCLNAEA